MKKNIWIGILIVAVILVGVYFSFSDFEIKKTDSQNTNLQEQISLSYMDVSPKKAKELIDSNPNIIIIDVSPHYANGHIPGAINFYPLSTLQDATSTLDKDATYLLYCHADGPSRNGAQILIDAGFENVYRLENHYGGWVNAGYEIEM